MKIIIYTKTGCPWCNDALAFLKDKGLEFEEREVLGNPEFFQEMILKSSQAKAPTLDIDGHILADSDKDQIESYLREKGILK